MWVIRLLRIRSCLIIVLHVIQIRELRLMARFVVLSIKKLANWRWLWTAITRATEIENAYVYRYTNGNDDKFNNKLLRSYFDNN